ncbi:MAG: hypothetical protein H0X38_04555 [Planctomycetes bacterium]|nr:hypothetical protein [Planctomycetota bacterium]
MNASFPGFEDDEPKSVKPATPPGGRAPVNTAPANLQKAASTSAAKAGGAGSSRPLAAPTTAPSFEFEDEEPQKSASAAPKTPAAAAFNPFDQPVSVPIGGSGTGVKMDPPPPPAARKAPATASYTKGGAATPPPAAAEPEEEIELRPGRAAKDLWICPHCTTGNKPGRKQCRACGKSPDEPVIVPWFKQPKILAGIGGGVAVLLALMLFTGGADLSMAVPGPAHLDERTARIGGAPHTPGLVKLGEDRTFEPRHQLAVSGRVVMCQSHAPAPWLTAVVLALGKEAISDESMNTMSADWGSSDYQVQGLVPTVTLYFINDGRKYEYPKNTYLSIVGDTGDLEEGGKIVEGTRASGAHVVRVRLEQTP